MNPERMFTTDEKSPECFANKRRLHNPENKEFAFAYQFHEDTRMLYQLAFISPTAFQKQLESLKHHIAAYENE